MTLPKHLRPRWRYLAVEIRSWPDADISRSTFRDAIDRSVRSLFGDAGEAKVELGILRFEHVDGSGGAVVRVRRGDVAKARAGVACVCAIGGASIGLRVRGVSGTVRACEENYLGREPEELPENTVVFEGAERPAVMRGADIDVRVDGAYVGATRLDLD